MLQLSKSTKKVDSRYSPPVTNGTNYCSWMWILKMCHPPHPPDPSIKLLPHICTTMLIDANALPLSQTATMLHNILWCLCQKQIIRLVWFQEDFILMVRKRWSHAEYLNQVTVKNHLSLSTPLTYNTVRLTVFTNQLSQQWSLFCIS